MIASKNKQTKSKSEFKVSVIIPIYNVEAYLPETIESVLNQTIGFKKNVELILVDDGSPDNSAKVCQKYHKKYPSNIVYIRKKNGGVSSARNRGLKVARGKYIAFLDSDDKYSEDYLKRMCAMLDRNNNIAFCAARVKWFGAKNGYHVADKKFTETRVVDLDQEPNSLPSLISSIVARSEAVSGIIFDESMTHNEDAKFIDTVIVKSGVYKCGLVREAELMYRKREEEVSNSASDTAKDRHSFYVSTINYVNFLSSGIKKYSVDGKIPKFIQFHALYHYRWRFTQKYKPDVLTDAEWGEYKKSVLDGIRSLDESTLLAGSINLNLRHKVSLLYVKFRGDKSKIKQAINKDPLLRQKLVDEIGFTVSTINFTKSGGLVIEGTTAFCEPEVFNAKLKFSVDGQELSFTANDSESLMFDEPLINKSSFSVTIPYGQYGNLAIKLVGSDGVSKQLDITYLVTSRISMRRNDYRIVRGKILLLPQRNSLEITEFKLRKVLKREALLFAQNFLRNKHRIVHNKLKTLAVELIRLAALGSIARGPSKVWLFSDRTISATDNSSVLFKYVVAQNDPDIKPYFVVNKGTTAFERLKKEGYKVVPFKSLRHLYLAIVSEVILPSHMDLMYLYPWFGVWRKYCGLIQYDIAHTQHGIVLNDISNYIGKHKKNASIFLSVCEWEQKHLTDGSYGYTKEQVPVTGLPRFDDLVDTSNEQSIIALSPTWRSWIAGKEHDGQRAYSEKFKESDYYQFFQGLINDKRLLKALKDNNYTMRFYVHPNHIANQADFKVSNNRVEMMSFPYDYNQIFSESKLFVTDYSNTLFDFAYLRKPIIHTQFDFDSFFIKHGSYEKQLFDYRKDGFGPVCTDYESTVKMIVDYLNRDIKIEPKYKRRINDFFTYNDRNNCKRAYKFIRNYYLTNKLR